MFKRALIAVSLLAAGCTAADDGARDFPFAPAEDGKSDVLGRKLAGVAAPYAAVALDETAMKTDARARRIAAWDTAAKVLEEVPLLGLAETAAANENLELPGGEVPNVPRFETWYGIDDIKRIFGKLYEGLDPNGRAARRPFTDDAIEAAFRWNATALDRSDRWPLERYLDHVNQLGKCPDGLSADACARFVASGFGGTVSGNARILYSPATVAHILRNYRRVVDCLAELDTLAVAAPAPSETHFAQCFEEEFPQDAVLVKANWVRADVDPALPVWDTDAAALTRRLSGTADWGTSGDRKADPGADKIYTIRLRDGSLFRLAGMHIMTKELRHWQWITLWWSDKPKSDFGADRPSRLKGAFASYKMCAVSFYDEGDADPGAKFGSKPTLAAALRATSAGGAPTWCSNPYVEHGRGNAKTNCIGCHQHGGATRGPDLDGDGKDDKLDLEKLIAEGRDGAIKQVRQLFAADYLYSYNHVDDYAHMLQSEIAYYDRSDLDAVRPRIEKIQALTGDAAEGAQQFADTCAGCHGAAGLGTARAPSLADRVPMREDESILRTLIQGKGAMPKWGERFDDQRLADLLAHLRAKFGRPESP